MNIRSTGIDAKSQAYAMAIQANVTEQPLAETGNFGTVLGSQEDSFTLSNHTDIYNNYSPNSAGRIPTAEEQLDLLLDIIKSDQEFMERMDRTDGRCITEHPNYNDLMNLIIKNLDQDILKKAIWINVGSYYNYPGDGDFGDFKRYQLDYKSDYKEYNIDALLNGPDCTMRNFLIGAAQQVVNKKVLSGEGTEAEMMFDPLSTKLWKHYGKDATFTNKMQSVADYFDAELAKAKLETSIANSFTFKLTSDYKFSVSGTNSDSATLIANLLNSNNDLVYKAISSVYWHRNDDGSYNSWNTPFLSQYNEYDSTGTSSDYDALMDNLYKYTNRFLFNNLLNEQYGLSLADFLMKDGKLAGNSEKAQEVIDNNQIFRKYAHGDSIERLLTEEIPNVDFSLITFTLEDGRFTIDIPR